MSELLLNDEKLTTADIAHPEKTTVAEPSAIDDHNLHPGQAVPAPLTAREATPLFPEDELHNFRARWDQVQTSFLDEPRQAVEQADTLVANVVKRIAEKFATERGKLENQWAKGDSVNTEDLRQSLKRYRSFFDRLLAF